MGGGITSDITVSLEKEDREDWKFSVAVDGTHFSVLLDKDYWQLLTGGTVEPAELVRRSFIFTRACRPRGASLAPQ